MTNKENINRFIKKFILFLFLSINIFSANKKILIIGSYHKEFQFQQDYIDGIKNTLGKKYDYYEFFLNTKKVPESEFVAMSDKAFDYYKEIKPDLVVLGDDNALKLLKDRFILEKIPVVFLGINANIRKYFKQRPNNFTGVLERPFYQRNIAFVKEVVPSLKEILIIFDDSETSRTILQESFQGKFTTKLLNMNITIRLTNSYETWKEIVEKESPKYGAVILGLYATVKDNKGKHIDENYLIDWTSKNVQKPLFGTWSFSVGKGKTIGGLVLSGIDQGVEAGKIIEKILEKGQKPISIFPVTADKGEYIISKSESNRWKVKVPSKYNPIIKLVE